MEKMTTRLAVTGLCCVGGLCVAGEIVLAAMGRPGPASLSTVAALCLGAVAGLVGRSVHHLQTNGHSPPKTPETLP